MPQIYPDRRELFPRQQYSTTHDPDKPISKQPMSHQAESHSDDLNVICPHCLYAYQAEAEDHDEREREVICAKCDREFLLCDEMSVTHRTRPLP